MFDPLYTLGYARWSIEEVQSCVEALDATLVDVRYRPHTSKPGFDRESLRSRFGPQYQHLPAFGNVNYQEGPVELADPEACLRAVQRLSAPLILLCGCKAPSACHRTDVAERIVDHYGGTIEHLQSPEERAQPGLF
jgi:hypothetical protein